MSYSGPLFGPSGQQTGQKSRKKLRMGSFVAFYGSKRQEKKVCVWRMVEQTSLCPQLQVILPWSSVKRAKLLLLLWKNSWMRGRHRIYLSGCQCINAGTKPPPRRKFLKSILKLVRNVALSPPRRVSLQPTGPAVGSKCVALLHTAGR